MDLFYVNGESEGYEDVARIQLSQAQETDSKSLMMRMSRNA